MSSLGKMSRAGAVKGWTAQGQRGNRLKAVNLDPLETIGLPSKGDDRYCYRLVLK